MGIASGSIYQGSSVAWDIICPLRTTPTMSAVSGALTDHDSWASCPSQSPTTHGGNRGDYKDSSALYLKFTNLPNIAADNRLGAVRIDNTLTMDAEL